MSEFKKGDLVRVVKNDDSDDPEVRHAFKGMVGIVLTADSNFGYGMTVGVELYKEQIENGFIVDGGGMTCFRPDELELIND